MPFGIKTDILGRPTDFDAVYEKIISPAVSKAGLDPLRADEERIGGAIHKPMFERLMLCPYAVADITGANPNVFYELGIRHAMRPRATVVLFAQGATLPFDIAMLRCIPYRTNDKGEPTEEQTTIDAVAAILSEARERPHDDSPVFQLVTGLPRNDTLDHSKTDVFRENAVYSTSIKERLAAARKSAQPDAVKAIEADPKLYNLNEVEMGVIIDMFLSYRAVKAHDAMIALYKRMPEPLQRSKMIREQYGFALNREGRQDEAEDVLKKVIAEFGPSSETNGLLGRVYKDRWDAAKKANSLEQSYLLECAIENYLAGFQADWRDAFPGVNTVTLMEMQDEPDPRQAEMLPVVRYAAAQKAKKSGDYWDFATLLELDVLARNQSGASRQLGRCLATITEGWQAETTARNLRLIRESRQQRGEDAPWVQQVEEVLLKKAAGMATPQKS